MFCLMSKVSHHSLISFAVSRVSLSEITRLGSPYCGKSVLARSAATPFASIISLHGIKKAALKQSWSTIVRIVSQPSDSGSFIMKSRVIVSKGRAFSFVLMGNSGGFGFPGKFLFAWHVAQPCTYAEMSSFVMPQLALLCNVHGSGFQHEVISGLQ